MCMEWNEFDGICPFCAACVAQFCSVLLRFGGGCLRISFAKAWEDSPPARSKALPLLHLSKPWTMRDFEVDHGRRIKATEQQSFVVASLCLKPPGWSVVEQACTEADTKSACDTKTICAAGISTSQSLQLRGKKGNPKKCLLAKLGQSYKVLCSAFRS